MFRNNENKKWFGMIVAIVMCLAVVGTTFGGQTIYVDADATGANDGSSWANAYNYLQDALAGALSGDEIWVAEGTYKPDANSANPGGSSDREATFQLINGVAIKGGYAGFGEPNPNVRDVDAYETILSGDLAGDDAPVADPRDLRTEPTRAENSYHVVTSSGTDATAVLDGFSLTGGNANGSYPNYYGGGMYNPSGSPTLANCTFTGNSAKYYGGGMYNDDSSPTVTNCIFSGNSADENGGGMYNSYSSSPTLTHCTFSGNSASANGGGMYNDYSSPTLTNCTFSGNWAGDGGGMKNYESSPTLTNCTFNDNSANLGGGMYNSESSPTLTNCTFSGNSAALGGGGMRNSFSANPTLTNCTFTGNSTKHSGGGMSNQESAPKLTNCTFSGNSAESNGGGMYTWGSSPTLINCILWYNTAGHQGPQIALYDSTLSISYCDLHGGQTEVYDFNSAINWGSGNIDADPIFVDADGPDNIIGTEDDNLRLSADSNCIDAGDNDAVPLDANDIDGDGNTVEPIPWNLDGPPRFVDDPNTADTGNGTPPVVDMGAYEFIDMNYIEITGPTEVDEDSGAQYTCTAYYSGGSTSIVTDSATWSEDSTYASIESNGYLTTTSVTSEQPCTITASYGGMTDTHDITIKDVPRALTSIEISGPAEVNENSGAQYTCTAHYDGSSSDDVTDSVNWSEDSTYASIDDNGYLTTGDVPSNHQQCTITASYGGKSDTHDVIIKGPSDISLQKCAVKAGKSKKDEALRGEVGFIPRDSIRVSGIIDVNAAEMDSADEIYVDIWSDSDDYLVYSDSVTFYPDNIKGDKYSYRHMVKRGEPGTITSFKLNLDKGKFSLKAKNIDLTGLGSPLSVEIEMGDYYGAGEADEEIVNGPRKSIPIRLMSGYADTLTVDKCAVGPNTTNTTSLLVKGGIALEDEPDTIGDVVVTLGSQTFTIPGDKFYEARNGAEVCKKAEVLEGGICSAKFDPVKCSFIITIKNTTIESKSGKVDFSISAYGSFKETVEVDLD